MITFTPAGFEKLFCVYRLIDIAANQVVFIWYSKAIEVLTLANLRSNPAFDLNRAYTLEILTYHQNNIDAVNAAGAAMRATGGMPELNKTIKWNRKGPIICNETGQQFNNQAEAVKLLGINQSRLCQHLRGVPGYKSIKGMTFRFSGFYGGTSEPVQPVIYPAKPEQKYFAVWTEKAPGSNDLERRKQVTLEQFNQLPEANRMILT